MNSYNLSLTFESIKLIIRMILDIGIMWMLLYYAIKIVKNSSRTIQIFKGIVLILLVEGISKFLGLTTVSWLAGMFVNWGFLAAIIVFQPEIRSILEKIGKTSVFSRISSLSGNEKENLVNAVVTASMLLSRNQTGALITLEQSQSLNDYINTGTKINSVVSAELLTSIFVTSTPLHDGAVIIQGDRIACASAYFPLTNAPVPSRYGTRHRAAIGISEITDAVTIVISEETGSISVSENGKIVTVNRKELREYLNRVINGRTTEVNVETRSLQRPVSVIVEREESHSASDDEYVIEGAKSETTESPKNDTSVLGRLAIKRYSEEEDDHAEEVSVIEEKPEVKIEKPEKKKFSLFGKKKNSKEAKSAAKEESMSHEEDRTDQLNLAENNIKLPKKKIDLEPISFELDRTTHLPKLEDTAPQGYVMHQNIRAMGDTGTFPRTSTTNLELDTQGLSGEEIRRARLEAIKEKNPPMEHPVHNQNLTTINEATEPEKKTVKLTMDFSDDFMTKNSSFSNTTRRNIVDEKIEEQFSNSQLGGDTE